MFLPILFSVALAAGDCPWGAHPAVAASGHTVYVDSIPFDVRTESERAEFRRFLRTCGAIEAAPFVDGWRNAKGLTTAGAVLLPLGILAFLFLPLPTSAIALTVPLVWLVVAPLNAASAKRRMIEAIEEPYRED